MMPFPHLLAGLAQNLGADLAHQSNLSGRVDERVRKQFSARRMLPADQRLHALDLVRRQIEDRLIFDIKFRTLYRALQLGLEPRCDDCSAMHGIVENQKAGTPAFCFIHRDIGVAENLFGQAVIFGRKGDADAGRGKDLLAAEPNRVAHDFHHPFRHRCDVARFLEALDKNREFIATNAGDDVVGAHGFGKTIGDFNQHHVAAAVTKTIVNQFETVEIEQQHRQVKIWIDRHPFKRPGKMVHEELPVVDGGEGVVEGKIMQPGLDPLTLLDICL